MSNERSWPSSLGLLDWDSTNIVFTKRSLIEFLKYTGTTVDPNFTTIAKLPRYAKFGNMSASTDASDAASTSVEEPTGADAQAPVSPSNSFKPSRRVRTAPGGTHSDIFGYEEDDDDALSNAPPKPSAAEEQAPANVPAAQAASSVTASQTSGFKPTRRVRTNPGGTSSMSDIFGAEDAHDEFKPTRRVREGPGGQDHIGGFF
ncbi:hypothetical protein P691DRAFT_808408 [Macrolepiota fuliginosa MF-IS2]|uniref:Uncharacterized protein n=1 Tax=Macrolepiota fuliginosa MF-IS2 TaxID=1400762 RepID=A0A9P5XGZ5_9AGAR|nr:hypothetical protein P691DRAFT_808408 [Macrolepiota fuliginosa MF-IS2]